MAAFSTPFWLAVASVAALAAGVSYLARPQDDGRAHSSAQALAEIDRHTRALADVPTPPDPDEAQARNAAPAAVPRAGLPFTIDKLGRLVVSAKTLPVLDSWLASAGPSRLLAPLEARLRADLPALAAERAWDLLRRYAGYRDAERELLNKLKAQGPVNAREQLDQTMALRRRHFDSATVQELFGVQEARGLYASEVARILADPSLSEAQQMQRLLALRMSLPPEVAAQEFGGSEFSFAMEREVARMRAEGESDDEVVFLRKQFVDSEGAKSVIEIEREQFETQRQAWALRHPTFVRQRDEILNAELDVTDKQERLEELLRQHFGPGEIDQARAYSGI